MADNRRRRLPAAGLLQRMGRCFGTAGPVRRPGLAPGFDPPGLPGPAVGDGHLAGRRPGLGPEPVSGSVAGVGRQPAPRPGQALRGDRRRRHLGMALHLALNDPDHLLVLGGYGGLAESHRPAGRMAGQAAPPGLAEPVKPGSGRRRRSGLGSELARPEPLFRGRFPQGGGPRGHPTVGGDADRAGGAYSSAGRGGLWRRTDPPGPGRRHHHPVVLPFTPEPVNVVADQAAPGQPD